MDIVRPLDRVGSFASHAAHVVFDTACFLIANNGKPVSAVGLPVQRKDLSTSEGAERAITKLLATPSLWKEDPNGLVTAKIIFADHVRRVGNHVPSNLSKVLEKVQSTKLWNSLHNSKAGSAFPCVRDYKSLRYTLEGRANELHAQADIAVVGTPISDPNGKQAVEMEVRMPATVRTHMARCLVMR